MTAHATLGASSAKRWMACPGSIRLSKGAPNTTSVFAAEGTAAHELAEDCLRDWSTAEEHLDDTIRVEADIIYDFKVDEEMADAVQVYLDCIRQDFVDDAELSVEAKFDLSDVYPGMFGTNDACLYYRDLRMLRVYDYKHGQGIAVEAENNPQLMYYALGACLAEARPVEQIELIVVQPRCPHPAGPIRRWKLSPHDLIEWSADLIEAAKATEEPDAPLHAGDHCKFCPAAGFCTELHKRALEIAKADFTPTGEMIVSDPSTFDAVGLGVILRDASILENWIKSVRAYAHTEAEHGRLPTGFKLVPKRATRKWISEELLWKAVRKLGIKKADLYVTDPKLKSPAQVEKLVAKDKRSLIKDLVTQQSSGATLAPVDDPREAVKPEAETDFSPIGEEQV